MKTQHTPGPWHIGMTNVYNVDRFAKNAEWARIRGVDGGLIAKIESVHPKGERKSQDFDIEAANAALIAAAPELLSLLLEVYDTFTDDNYNPPNHKLRVWLDQTKAVILKATTC